MPLAAPHRHQVLGAQLGGQRQGVVVQVGHVDEVAPGRQPDVEQERPGPAHHGGCQQLGCVLEVLAAAGPGRGRWPCSSWPAAATSAGSGHRPPDVRTTGRGSRAVHYARLVTHQTSICAAASDPAVSACRSR